MSDKKKGSEEEPVQFGDELAVLPIRNAVLFPGAVAPFDVGREKSVALVEDVDSFSSPVIAIFAQRDPATDDPGAEDLHPVGCAARVLKALKHSSGNYSLILQGLQRIRLDEVVQGGPYLKARVKKLEDSGPEDDEVEAHVKRDRSSTRSRRPARSLISWLRNSTRPWKRRRCCSKPLMSKSAFAKC
jgi:ATP-dependent Lon protease